MVVLLRAIIMWADISRMIRLDWIWDAAASKPRGFGLIFKYAWVRTYAWYDYYKQILLIGEQKINKLLCFWHPQCRQGGRGGYVHRNIGWKSMFRFLLEFQILVFSPIKSLTCSMDDKHFGNSVKYFREHKHLALFLNHSIWHMPNIRTVLPNILPQDK